MRGTVHTLIGASAPVGLVLFGHVSLVQGSVMSAVSAGVSLWPDLDHPRSTASRALGKAVHKTVHGLCRTAVTTTALHGDRISIQYQKNKKRDPYHRTLTHTLAASAAVGFVSAALTYLSDVTCAMVAALAVLTLWPLYPRRIGLLVLVAVTTSVGSVLYLDPLLMGTAVAGGYVSHVMADGCTVAGVPALWPLKINGKRWWSIRLLGTRIPSGSHEEKIPAVGVAAVLNVLLVLIFL